MNLLRSLRPRVKADPDPILGYYLPPEEGARPVAVKSTAGIPYGAAVAFRDGAIQPSPEGFAYAYTVSTWAYKCTLVRAKNVGKMPWKVVDKSTKETLPEHPLAVALNRNKQKLFRKTEFSQVLFGETFIEKIRNTYQDARNRRGTPADLSWLNNLGMDVDTSTGEIGSFNYSPVQGGKYHSFRPEDVAFMHSDNPFDDLRGLSPFLVILDELGIDRDVARVVRAFFANDARVGKWLIPKTQMQKPDLERFMEWFKSNFQGPRNAGKPALLSHPVDVQDSQSRPSLDDMQLRESTRREICAALGVPLAIAGAWDDANYDSVDTQRKSFYEETIMPECDDIADFVNEQILPFFDPALSARFEFDYSAILALTEDTNDRVSKLNNKLLSGGITLNRYREQIGEKPLGASGEVLYIPSGVTVTPLAKIGQMPAPTPTGLPPGGLFQHNPPLVQNAPAAHALITAPETPKQIAPRVPQKATEAPIVSEACYVILSLANDPAIKTVQNSLHADYPYVEWADPKSFHITLVYAPQAADLQTVQDILPKSISALTFEIGPLDTFPAKDGKQPIILRVKAPGPLLALQNQLHSAFRSIGLSLSDYSEPSAWQPHVTLGYMPEGKPLPNYQGVVTVTSGNLEATIEQGDTFKRIAVAAVKTIDVKAQDTPEEELAAWEKKALNGGAHKALSFVCYRLPDDVQAQVKAGLSALPKDAPRAQVKVVFAAGRLALKDYDKDYDPNQPRDDSGRWGSGGSSGSSSAPDKPKEPTTPKQPEVVAPQELGGARTYQQFDDANSANEFQAGAAKEWQKSLSSDEVSALHDYQILDYKDVNNDLRGIESWDSPGKTKMIKSMDSAIAKSAVPQDLVAHRGVQEWPEFYDSVKSGELGPGSIYEDKGYHSVALNKGRIGAFTDSTDPANKPVEIEVRIPKGSHAAFMSEYKSDIDPYYKQDTELLLPRRSQFKVVSVNSTPDDNVQRITVELMSGGGK